MNNELVELYGEVTICGYDPRSTPCTPSIASKAEVFASSLVMSRFAAPASSCCVPA
jgi:hypothetical protein